MIVITFKLVRHDADQDTNAKSNVLMCEVKGGWKEFEDSLSSLKAPPGRMLIGEKARQVQQQWWAKNGKPFRILDLPSELRLNILEQAMVLNSIR